MGPPGARSGGDEFEDDRNGFFSCSCCAAGEKDFSDDDKDLDGCVYGDSRIVLDNLMFSQSITRSRDLPRPVHIHISCVAMASLFRLEMVTSRTRTLNVVVLH